MGEPMWRRRLRRGLVIPAHPLALTARRRLDERRQRALTRYYLAAGAGGVAVGVHTTQFAIHDPRSGLLGPVLELAAETARAARPTAVLIAGICGGRRQAIREARLAVDLGYHAALVSFVGLERHPDDRLIEHLEAIGEVIPVFAFYLQPAVGGRPLDYRFWRRVAALERVVAIKIAPFDRYRTLDVVRAVHDAGRAGEIALYTGNDDHILLDLLTSFRPPGSPRTMRIVGGLLGQWAVWTHRAVAQHARCRRVGAHVPRSLLTLAAQLTDANAAIFDVAHRFRGSIAGVHEVLRRHGLLRGRWCLDPNEDLSPGQARAIERIWQAYPHLRDDDFVAAHRDAWLR
ncbi:MAG TPA: dihydrodipicolinate synthase family protein [Gemmatimonadales bacterium]|nr:dihydrodipicolinate synthase family protein [Gemmatimonadales bacterium]